MSLAEQQTEWIINNNLINKQWIIDNVQGKNVFFQKSPFPEHQKKLEIVEKKGKYKKPDYILYTHKYGNPKPIAIIEAKSGGKPLVEALKQATDYAEALEAPLVFCTNGSGKYQTKFLPNGKELYLNGNELDELIREKEALLYIEKNTNDIETIPQKVRVSRDDLIKIFKNLNDTLRGEGIRAGIERFSEFANILFLKLLSENEQKSWWNSIKNQSNDDIIGYINGYVIEQIQKKYGGNVFTPINIKNPKTLREVIDNLDPLVLSTIDTDIKGDAFEYFLEKTTSTENDLGEYFTPRHIVKAIVNLVDPKPKETIYDPFCGTGGFLTGAFHYIKENKITNNEEDLKVLRNHTLFGREITTTARIAKMNMVLHGDGHSGITQEDSLNNPNFKETKIIKNRETGEEEEIEMVKKFDIIITNMPFSQTITRKIVIDGKTKIVNDITNKYNNGLAKNNGDAVCVLHCLNNLKKGGRMALVVPEGFLFRKDVASVREYLLKSAKLQSVISLPQGAFLPYTGVKTDILYFTNAHEPNNQKEYWYFDVKNIGYTLDNNRRKIKENDLTKIDNSDIKKIDKIKDDKEKLQLRSNMLEIGFETIAIEKLKHNDYNFIGSVYREALKYNGKYELTKLSDVCLDIKNGINVAQDKFEGKYRVSRIESISTGNFNIEKTSFTNDEVKEEDFLERGDILFSHINSFEHLGKTAIFDGNYKYKVIHGINLVKLRPNKDKIIPKYLSFLLKSETFINSAKNLGQRAVNQASIRVSALKELSIPLPPLEEQQKIVEELDNIQKSINNAKGLIESLKVKGGVVSLLWE